MARALPLVMARFPILGLAIATALAAACVAQTSDTQGRSGKDAGSTRIVPPNDSGGIDAGLDDAGSCNVVPSGCDAGGCSFPYKPLDLSVACSSQRLLTAQEGTCGEYRFQIAYDYSGYERYWSLRTGKLVASVAVYDTNDFCHGTVNFQIQGDPRVVEACKATVSATPNQCQTYHPTTYGGPGADGGADGG